MPTELIDDDNIETLNIGDEGTDEDSHIPGDDETGDENSPEDRGDDFVDPESEPAEKKPASDDATGDDPPPDTKAQDKGGDEEKGTGVPFQRLNEVARVKSAATAIADAVVEGLIDPSIIKELGGANAVAKAIANREITLEELQSGATIPSKQGDGEQQAPTSTGSEAWNLDNKYVEYQELVDAGEVKEAAVLLRQINKEERARERAEEQAVVQQGELNTYITKIMKDYPTLADVNSRDHKMVKALTNEYHSTGSMSRQAALAQAIDLFFGGNHQSPPPVPPPNAGAVDETPQQRVIRERKEAAIRRGAEASAKQPPSMGLGATPQSTAKIDPSKLSQDEYESLTPEQRKSLDRGDTL